MRKLYVLLLALVLVSCEKEAGMELDALGENAGIVGTWVEEQYLGDTLWLARSEELDFNNYGFSIQGDGTFVERKNAGWLDTSPVSYDNFEGTWKAVSDSLLDITVGYWGGTMTYQIRIVSLDAKELAIKYLYTEARQDSR